MPRTDHDPLAETLARIQHRPRRFSLWIEQLRSTDRVRRGLAALPPIMDADLGDA